METRDAVVTAADGLFYARGVHAVGMDAVRDAAGVSLKRLYGLFPSKSALVEDVLRRRHELWQDGLRAAVQAGATPRAQVLAIYDFLAGWFVEADFRGCGFVNMFGELGGTDVAVATLAREHKASFVSLVDDLLAPTGVRAGLAEQLVLLAEGAQTMAALGDGTDRAVHARRAQDAAALLLDAYGVA